MAMDAAPAPYGMNVDAFSVVKVRGTVQALAKLLPDNEA